MCECFGAYSNIRIHEFIKFYFQMDFHRIQSEWDSNQRIVENDIKVKKLNGKKVQKDVR